MSERKTCIRCERTIDKFAKICPYCNWDQAVLPPPRQRETAEAAPAAAYVAERENRNRRMLMLIGGFIVLLIAAFAIGSLVHGFDVDSTVKTQGQNDKDRHPAAPIGTAVTPEPKGANVQLVPATGPATPQEAPITSAPVPSSAGNTADRSDATALPSDQYSQAAARAKAERQAALTDPRTIIGSPYDQRSQPAPRRTVQRTIPMSSSTLPTAAPPPSEAPLPPRHIARTLPIPESQPLPDIRVSRTSTVRLNLTIGPDGRVHEVDVIEPIPGEMPKLIAAVQNWRFRPATENGLPVASHFSVDISFRAND
jgi:protein TonB